MATVYERLAELQKQMANGRVTEERGEETGWTPALVRLDTVEPEEVDFLWYPRIPLRKLTLLSGPPGLGKTHLALNIASIVSNGFPFPDEDGVPREQREPGNVLILSAEDGVADTLVPRLRKAGANMSRIYVLKGSVEHPDDGINLSTDLFLLAEAAKQVKPSLIIIDPIQGYIGGVDMHRANEIRPVLSALARLAEEHSCAVLAIGHLTKSMSERAIYRALGSIDFVAAARSMLLLDQHPDDEGLRVLAHAKSNLAPLGKTQTFRLIDGAIQWAGAVDLTAEDLNAPRDHSSEERGSRDEAVDWLRDVLQDGPQYSHDLIKRAKKELGVSERTLRRAKAAIGAEHFKEDGQGGRWMWKLSGDDPDDNLAKDSVGKLGKHTSNPLLDGVSGKFANLANRDVGKHESEQVGKQNSVCTVAHMGETPSTSGSASSVQVCKPEMPYTLTHMDETSPKGATLAKLDKFPEVASRAGLNNVGQVGQVDVLGHVDRVDEVAATDEADDGWEIFEL